MAESRVEQVTVYASGARVVRVAAIAAPGLVRLTGLPLALIDDSVSASVEGSAVVVAIRTSVDAPAQAEAVAELSSELRTARRAVALADTEVARLERALGATAAIVATDDRDEPAAPWAAVVVARQQLVAVHAARAQRLRTEHAVAWRTAREARERLAAIEDREARASSARAPKLHELRKAIELDVIGEGPSTVRVEYRVAAARWAPTYVARLDGDRVMLEVRAVVAQETGEDWTDVALRLSTAEPAQFASLPELAAQRIGRRQDSPGRSGFRAPPQGARALYADYEDAFPPLAQELQSAKPQVPHEQQELAREVWDDDSSHAKDAFLTPPSGNAMPRPQPLMQHASRSEGGRPRAAMAKAMAFAAAPSAMPSPLSDANMARGGYGGGGAPPGARQAPAPTEPVPRLDYTDLVMAPADAARRGSLVPAPQDPLGAVIANELADAIGRVARRALPPGCVASWAHSYDYAFASDGNVDVRADGVWHSLALTAKEGTAKLGHVAVPREQADVFRMAAIANPLPAPLLPGPIDVYDRGRFLVTSAVDYTPPGATVEVGLGVDPTVKIARNTEYREETTGMLRGALRLHHGITIDVDNLSGKPIELEVRERIPVKREGDDDIEITLGRTEPAWERWTPEAESSGDPRLRGAYRWRLAIPAAGKKTMRAQYEVKIAGKLELIGGNRRES